MTDIWEHCGVGVGATEEEGVRKETRGAWTCAHREFLEWSVASGTTVRSNQVRTESCPSDVATRRLAVTVISSWPVPM